MFGMYVHRSYRSLFGTSRRGLCDVDGGNCVLLSKVTVDSHDHSDRTLNCFFRISISILNMCIVIYII